MIKTAALLATTLALLGTPAASATTVLTGTLSGNFNAVFVLNGAYNPLRLSFEGDLTGARDLYAAMRIRDVTEYYYPNGGPGVADDYQYWREEWAGGPDPAGFFKPTGFSHVFSSDDGANCDIYKQGPGGACFHRHLWTFILEGVTDRPIDYQLALTNLPEPGAWLLMISGIGLAGAALRRRRVIAMNALSGTVVRL